MRKYVLLFDIKERNLQSIMQAKKQTYHVTNRLNT
jgi:hypothetical protein